MTLTPEAPEGEPVRYGLVLEWPPPGKPPARIRPYLLSVFTVDADGTERQLPGVTRMTLHLAVDDLVTAEVETLLGEDGEPVRLRELPAVRDGEPATAVLRYEVAAVRVRD